MQNAEDSKNEYFTFNIKITYLPQISEGEPDTAPFAQAKMPEFNETVNYYKEYYARLGNKKVRNIGEFISKMNNY